MSNKLSQNRDLLKTISLFNSTKIKDITTSSSEFRIESGYLQHRVSSTAEWENVVSIEDLRGPQGLPGADGDDGYTPIKDVDYFDGAPGSPGAKGDKGDPGEPGAKGEDGLTQAQILARQI